VIKRVREKEKEIAQAKPVSESDKEPQKIKQGRKKKVVR